MIDNDAMIKTEVYTELLNDMFAVLSEYIDNHPYSVMRKELDLQRQTVAIAHTKSRFYSDEAHFSQWDKVLSASQNMLRKAGCIDVHR